jgi:hypothetical protein
MKYLRLLRRLLNIAVCFLGFLSPFYLFVVWASTHDIYNDYLSTNLFSRYKAALPGWYDGAVHSCHLEWNALSIAFVLISMFHILLFARLLLSRLGPGETRASQTPVGS